MKRTKNDRKRVIRLEEEDVEIGSLAEKYRALRERSRVTEVIASQKLAALRDQPFGPESEALAARLLKEIDEEKQRSSRELALTYMELDRLVRDKLGFRPNLPSTTVSVSPLASAFRSFPGCQLHQPSSEWPFFPLFLGASGSWDESISVKAPSVDNPPWATALNATNDVCISVDAVGHHWGHGFANWFFKLPSNRPLCGFELSADMSLAGIVNNKFGSCVTIDMEASIYQYRTDKPWDQIRVGFESSADPAYRYLQCGCHVPGSSFRERPYIDDTYGFHYLSPPIQRNCSVRFFSSTTTNPSTGPGDDYYDYQKDDLFFVRYWWSILVNMESAAHLFGYDPKCPGTLVIYRPSVAFYSGP